MSTSNTATRPLHTKTTVARSGVSFELLLDQSSYLVSSETEKSLTATLILRNLDTEPLLLAFAGQQFDVELRDASGERVALWSTGRVFDTLAQTIRVKGQQKWQASLPVPQATGGGVLSASYTATGYLTPAGAPTPFPPGGILHPDLISGGPNIPASPADPVRTYSATVGFIVRQLPVLEQDARHV